MIKRLLIVLVIFCSVITAQQLNNPQQILNKTDKNFFIQNKGQWNPEIKYLARIGGMNAWITNSGVVYDYYRIKKNYDEIKTLKMNPEEKRDYESKNTIIQGHVVRMQFINAESNITGVGNNRKEGYYNYFIGNNLSKWASFVPLYDNVELQGIYKNIDIKYYYNNGMLRYDYSAKPGADISQIKFKFDGQDRISINANGELILRTSIGEVTNGKIYAYQMEGVIQKKVSCKFEQREDGSIGLKTNSYDTKKELIIDPLVYSTFIGGNIEDLGNSIAIDAGGNAYITGTTESHNYPITPGAYQDTLGGHWSVLVTKLNSTGSALVYSTFIGGNNEDGGNSIAIDKNGNAYITGYTNSSNFPLTNGAFQTTLSVYQDAFVTKLNSTGSALLYSTYIGGNGTDKGNSIAIDAIGNAYITGFTNSSNFPTTSGAYQKTLGGGLNVFVTKLNSSGRALVYSTYIGGNLSDKGNSIAIDAIGNAYITGYTNSSNFPTTNGAYQKTLGGGINVFVTKLNLSGSALVYSTFIGGNDQDYGNSIAIDKKGNAYITGYTNSSNFPTSSGAFQTTFGQGRSTAFVTKLSSTGSELVYSTFIGGDFYDCGNSIALDSCGNAYLTGITMSGNYPITIGAYQNFFGAADNLDYGINAFVTELNLIGSDLVYSTFMGGNNEDFGNSIAVDAIGNVYITGRALSNNYPTTGGAYQTILGGTGGNALISKLKIPQIAAPDIVQQFSPISGSLGITQPVILKWLSSLGAGSYRLQLSTDSTFGTAPVDTLGLTDTTIVLRGLNNLTTYYWRVNAMNVESTSPWSEVWNFKTLGSPTKATLVYPAENSTNIPINVKFNWYKSQDQLMTAKFKKLSMNAKNITSARSTGKKTVASVIEYSFELTTDTTTTSYVVNDSTLADTTILVSGLQYLTDYWWRVRAMNEAGWGAYSNWGKFTTIIDTPNIVQQVSPLNGSLGNILPVQLNWIKSARAISYRLQFGTDSTSAATIVDTIGLADTIFSFNSLRNLITYYWRVNAMNAGGTSSWSPVWNFQILVDPTQAVLLYPANNSINIPVNVNFNWGESQIQLSMAKMKVSIKNPKNIANSRSSHIKNLANVSKYWFELTIDTTSTGYVVNDSTLSDTTILVSGLKNLTNYWWRVRVMYESGWGDYTSWSKFTTIIDTPSIVQQVRPLNGSLGNILPVQLNWISSARAGYYGLQLSADSTFSTTIVDINALSDTSFSVKSLSNLTTYYWHVNAANTAGYSNWSPVWNFKTLGSPTQTTLAYPAENSKNIPINVKFNWYKSQDQLMTAKLKKLQNNAKRITSAKSTGKKTVASVSEYWFELTTDTTTTSYVVNDSTLADTTILVSGLQYLTDYRWRVRAMNEAGWGAYTNWSKFTTIIYPPPPVNPPGIAALLSPNSSSNIPDTASSIIFIWGSAPFANTYELQIASDGKFSELITDTSGITDTVFTYHPKNLASTFYWRIQGSNTGGPGSWSPPITVLLIAGVSNMKNGMPVAYELYQNYPNPFNPATIIEYSIPKTGMVILKVYDILGREITTLVREEKAAGNYKTEFNASKLSSGVYFYRIQAGNFAEVKKLLLLK